MYNPYLHLAGCRLGKFTSCLKRLYFTIALRQETGLKKLTFVEMEDYPGFTESSSGLPQKIETASVLRLVTKAIKMLEKPG